MREMNAAATPSRADAILDKLIEHAADLDDLVDATEPAFQARVIEIMNEPSERNDEIWIVALDEADLDESTIDIGADDLETVPLRERDSVWTDSLAAIISTSQAQAFAEHVARAVIEHADRVSADVSGISEDAETWHDAAKRGVSKKAVAERRQARKAAAVKP